MAEASELNLLAALADAEVLRHDLAAARALAEARGQLVDRIERDLESLRRRLDAAEERQRELHVLLLHRDEEIARLHGYLAASPPPVPAITAPSEPATPAAPEAHAPPQRTGLRSEGLALGEARQALRVLVQAWSSALRPGRRTERDHDATGE